MKLITLAIVLFSLNIHAQDYYKIKGRVTHENEALPYVNVYIKNSSTGTTTDDDGYFTLSRIPAGNFDITASFVGFKTQTKAVKVSSNINNLVFDLEYDNALDEVVVTGTLKPVSRLESAVPVEVYSPAFFNKNPTPNIFEALQNVNGVRPQINCSVCNTGDIHINGLEGPYTLVLIDGMPIVSGLSTVYGLSGIPNPLIEQVEIVKVAPPLHFMVVRLLVA